MTTDRSPLVQRADAPPEEPGTAREPELFAEHLLEPAATGTGGLPNPLFGTRGLFRDPT